MPVIPIGMPAAHAEAFRKILAVTCRAWQLNMHADGAQANGASAGVRRSTTVRGRSTHLARLAARALEAQVMALRCRQAFVGQPG